jgi:hypothetical protein
MLRDLNCAIRGNLGASSVKDWLFLSSPWLAFICLVIWDTRTKQSWRTTLKEPMVLFTGVLAVGTIALALVAILQWRTLDKTDETLRAAQRPWMKYADVQFAGPLIYNENGLNISLRFFLKNTGNSPAQNVFPETFISVNPRDALGAGEQRRLCEIVRNRPRPVPADDFGVTYFPGDDPIQQQITVSVSKSEIAAAVGGLPSNFPFVFPVVFGCVNYRFPFGAGESHQTGFIFRVLRVDSGGPQPGALVGIDTRLGDIPVSDLRLQIGYVGSYAD